MRSALLRAGARAAVGLAVLGGPACRAPARRASEQAYRAQIVKWRESRLERLKSDTGWLTLAGLYWLEPGENSFGSDPANRVALPPGTAPDHAGTLFLTGRSVVVRVAPGVTVITHDGRPVDRMLLASDADDDGPTILHAGTASFYVIERGSRIGVRVKDTESAARKNFSGLDDYPIDSSWRFEARFEPYDPPKKISVPTEIGTPEEDVSPGALVFRVRGRSYRLDPVIEKGSDELFIIFGDRTNGKETYGAGRFLYAPMPAKGKTTLDFNKAYNPPCAFTPFATCPLPPAQNRLPFAVTAGEKAYRGPRRS